MKILLARTEGVPVKLINAVNSELIKDGGPLEFAILPNAEVPSPAGDSFEDFFEILRKLRTENQMQEEDHLCLLTEKENELNWFSAFDEEEANFFIHTEGWNYHIDCPPEIPITYQVLTNFFQKSAYGSFETYVGYAHEKTIGCINDMCSWKPDVSFKVRTGDICLDCCTTGLENGISAELLSQILEIMNKLREKALLSRDFTRTRNEDLPSTVAYTHYNLLIQHGAKDKFIALLNHFDSLLKTTVHLLGRIFVPDRIEPFLKTNELDQKPSFGHWVGAIKKLAEEEFSASTDLGLPDGIEKCLVQVGEEADDGQITQIRNSEYGHSYLQDDETYESAYDRCFPFVSRIEKILSPILTKVTLCQIGSLTNEGDQARIQFYEIQGDHPTSFKERAILWPTQEIDFHKLESGRIFGRTPNGEFHSLHRSFKREKCGHCNNERVLIADGKYYFDNYGGHRFPKN